MALSICSSCHRHVRGDDCPFCGAHAQSASQAASPFRTAMVIVGVAAIATTACGMGGYGGPPPDDPHNAPTSVDGGTTDSLLRRHFFWGGSWMTTRVPLFASL